MQNFRADLSRSACRVSDLTGSEYEHVAGDVRKKPRHF
jgi:hypothetical protein